MMTRSFKELTMWQKAHQFVLEVYRCTKLFPKEELYGLTSQFRRAAISIPANQAEGYRRLHLPEKLRFLNISQGSLEECRYYIILSKDLEYINEEKYILLESLIENASRLLNAYYSKVNEECKLKKEK